MAYGLRVWNSSGSLIFESTTAVGGVVADTRTFAGASTATLTYPDHAGRSVQIIVLVSGGAAGTADIGVAADTTLGYPRVTVAASSQSRTFMVVVF